MPKYPVSKILTRLTRDTAGQKKLTLEDVLESTSTRSLGPILLVLGLLLVSPLSGIPGMPTTLALLVFLSCSQILAGKDEIVLPEFLTKKGVERHKVIRGVSKLKKWTQKVETVFKPRLLILVSRPFRKVAALVGIILAACTPPMEFLPLVAAVPGLAIALIGLAITTHDGLLMLLGFMVVVAGAVGGFMFLS